MTKISRFISNGMAHLLGVGFSAILAPYFFAKTTFWQLNLSATASCSIAAFGVYSATVFIDQPHALYS